MKTTDDLMRLRAAYDEIRRDPPRRHSGSEFTHHRILPFATLAPWLDDGEFLALYQHIKSYTLVDLYRCYELYCLAKQSLRVSGCFLEVGVWRGGTGALIGRVASSSGRRTYLADTFCGVVKAGDRDPRYVGGEHADTSIQTVEYLLATLGVKNAELLSGIFPDDTGNSVTEKIAFLHCDVDVYQSARDVFEFCRPRMGVGSIVVFDDYGFFGCDGITRYVAELREDPDFVFLHNLNGHAVFIRVFEN
jgi:O-methyltransferase